MKKLSFLFMSLAVVTSIFVACTKDETNPTTALSTSLEITIKDLDNSLELVSGATVSISESADMSKPITVKTDAKGVAKFTDLKNIVYYIAAQKGCQNNLFGIYYTKNALKQNTLNKQDVGINGVGDLVIENKSETDTFNCVAIAIINGATTTIPGMPHVTLAPGAKGKYIKDPLPAGNTTMLGVVKVVDGKIVKGSDYIEQFTIPCGGTATVTLK
ncbi:MAG: hypothetical protein ACI7YS_03890 [Flavobacterium sp.]